MLDIEKLISEVEKRPLIYDQRANNYKNKDAKIRCWSEIAEAMFENWHNLPLEVQELRSKLLSSKWKGVRDNFVREYKILMKYEKEGGPPLKKSKYMHYDILLFLAPYVCRGAGDPKHNNSSSTHDEMLADKFPDVEPTQLLEMIYDDESSNNRRKSARLGSSQSETTPRRRKTRNPGESNIFEKSKSFVKSMTTKIPDKWKTDRNGAKSLASRIPGELSADRNETKMTSSRIPEQSTNNKEAMQVHNNANPYGVTSIDPAMAMTAQNPTHDFVYEHMPSQCDDRNSDKYGNKAFLLSFVPILDSLPMHQFLQARMRITEVFNEVVSNIPPESNSYTQL